MFDTFFRAIYGVTYPELIGLLDLLDEHEEAVAYDVIRCGLRLRDVGTEDFTWGDLLTIVRQGGLDTALHRATNEDWQWTLDNLLAAEVADSLNVANWQRSGGKKRDYPKPIPRPGVEPAEKTYGKGAIPIDEMADWLGWA